MLRPTESEPLSSSFVLDARLGLILDLLPKGLPLWDVGCDHGYLGFRALQNGIVPEAHFVEPSLPAMESLLSRWNSPGYESFRQKFKGQVHFHQCHGEDLPAKKPQGCAVLAGMGARRIRTIVGGWDPLPFRALILNPRTDWEGQGEPDEFLPEWEWAFFQVEVSGRREAVWKGIN